jgi:hypothetical protein
MAEASLVGETMDGRRIRDWLVGRREFRGIVVVDAEVARAHGGRPISGTGRAEFVQAATGPLDQARLEAAHVLHAWLDAEIPGAKLEALLDGGPPVEPGPRLRLVKGGPPCLTLVEPGETDHEQEEQLDRVVEARGLSRDRYRLYASLDDDERWMRLVSIVAGLVLGAPLTVLLLLRTMPDPSGPAAFLPRLVAGDFVLLMAAAVFAAVPVAGVFLRSARLAFWPARGRLIAAGFAVGPAFAFLGVAAIVDGITWLVQHYTVASAIPIGLGGMAASPFLALAVDGRWWRAGLGWFLPLAFGGVSLFVGGLMYGLYLGHYGLSPADVTVTAVEQWALGAVVPLVVLLIAYFGAAAWALGRRFGGRSLIVEALISIYVVVLLVVLALLGYVGLEQRAQIKESGLPTGMLGLEPRLACVEPVAGPYSYVGQPVDLTSGPVVYFGRADGRLAVWSERSGGVLLDGQAVALRFVQPGSRCS